MCVGCSVGRCPRVSRQDGRCRTSIAERAASRRLQSMRAATRSQSGITVSGSLDCHLRRSDRNVESSPSRSRAVRRFHLRRSGRFELAAGDAIAVWSGNSILRRDKIHRVVTPSRGDENLGQRARAPDERISNSAVIDGQGNITVVWAEFLRVTPGYYYDEEVHELLFRPIRCRHRDLELAESCSSRVSTRGTRRSRLMAPGT